MFVLRLLALWAAGIAGRLLVRGLDHRTACSEVAGDRNSEAKLRQAQACAAIARAPCARNSVIAYQG